MPLIGETTAAASTAAANEKKAGATGQLDNMGTEAFMKLLVAQMRYQNPMAPTDGAEYLGQISQYAMVEQMQKINEAQQEASAYQRTLIANSLIGKVVAGIGEAGTPVSGQVLGVAYQAGRPVLVTTDGELSVDKVDETRLPSNPGAAPSTAPTATTAPASSEPAGSTGSSTTEPSSTEASSAAETKE
jgi:flagellar basal-body rod modification protein FlgD